MSFALLIIGLALIVSAIRGTHLQLLGLVYGDFTGEANFWYWIAAILLVGAVGFVPKLKGLSDGLLVIILLVLVLKRGNPDTAEGGGFFQQFVDALDSTKSKAAATVQTAAVNTGVSFTQPVPGKANTP